MSADQDKYKKKFVMKNGFYDIAVIKMGEENGGAIIDHNQEIDSKANTPFTNADDVGAMVLGLTTKACEDFNKLFKDIKHNQQINIQVGVAVEEDGVQFATVRTHDSEEEIQNAVEILVRNRVINGGGIQHFRNDGCGTRPGPEKEAVTTNDIKAQPENNKNGHKRRN